MLNITNVIPRHTLSYRAPSWLPGGHLQTIYTALLTSAPRIAYTRERWDTPDGDFIDVDWLNNSACGPLVVFFHGLEGSSRGHYVRSLMEKLQHSGWRGIAVNFRGCSGEPNRLPRAYFAGDSAEIDWILRRLRALNPDSLIFAAGVSLGGNALLKWLGEQGDNACGIINAALTVSAAMDLQATGNALDSGGFNQLYAAHFLRTLKKKASQKLEQYPGLFDRELLKHVKTLRAFDDLFTAPLHGYKNTDDYWTRASSKPGLINIRVPTLLINARNDPFLPASALPRSEQVSACVTLEFPEEGGHMGFISGPFPGRHAWLPERILEFFNLEFV
ncbi:MAG: alpha/beta fold hydrolase [Gammaproteobacteria bacterium]|nr:alpha/beta fold hydrolase [Gammaproteobacteria bacterium]